MKIKIILLFLLVTRLSFAQEVSFTMDVSGGCAPLSVSFTNTSFGWNNPNNIRYEWYFDDGSSFTGKHADHIFTDPQNYWVSLSAFDATTNAYLGDAQEIVSVFGGGKSFSMNKDSACPNETVFFEYDNYSFLAMPLAVKWDFGDGTYSDTTYRYAWHSYNVPGEYTVNLITTTSCGSDTLSKKIIVTNSVAPSFGLYFNNNEWGTSTCPGRNVYFSSSWDYDLEYLWNFGDGDTSQQMNPVHSFDTTGQYIISLTATNLCGNSKTLTDTLTVDTNYTFPNVIVSKWSGTNCRYDTTYFYISPGGFFTPEFTGYEWNFGDGSFSFEEYPKHVYTQPGTFNGSVKLTQCAKDSIIYFSTTIDNCTVGIEKAKSKVAEILVYPNPFSASAIFKIPADVSLNSLQFSLYNTLGQDVRHINNITEQEIKLERKDLPSGIYFYKFFNSEGMVGEGKVAIP